MKPLEELVKDASQLFALIFENTSRVQSQIGLSCPHQKMRGGKTVWIFHNN